jgi:serine protease Do
MLVFTAAACTGKTIEETPAVKAVSTESQSAAPAGDGMLAELNESLARVAERVKPSVVNISTTKTISIKDTPFGDLFNDPFFRRFFGDEFGFRGHRREYKTSALGSGVIVSDDGYILTNNHVVKDVDEIKVILYDKREFKGKIIGTDPKSDLAIVKVDAKGLPAIRIGKSGNLRVGELVIAIGNPFGLGNTITMGIVSAVGRSNVGITEYEDFIQTDAAINPGNSGGALVNIRGELVGINTAIFSTSGGYMGIGFAIPSDMASSIMQSIIKHGKVVRGWLGVTIQNITPELAKHFDLKQEKGALVASVSKESPAERAGIKRGDVIIKYNGEEVDDTTHLRNMVAGTLPGKKMRVTLLRDGKEKTVTVNIGELKTEGESIHSTHENALSGVYVQDLTSSLKSSLGIPDSVTGVIVTNIDEGSPALGLLRRNDVIREINRKTIDNVKDFDKALSDIGEKDSVLLLIYRRGGYIYLTIKP